MQKPFSVGQIRDLLNQLHKEEITLSRFVEILNQHVNLPRSNMSGRIPTGPIVEHIIGIKNPRSSKVLGDSLSDFIRTANPKSLFETKNPTDDKH